MTPYDPTWTGTDEGPTWGDDCDEYMGQVLEVPDAQNTALKAIAFYVQRDTGTLIPSGFTPFGAYRAA